MAKAPEAVCGCLRQIHASCITNELPVEEFWWANDPEMGRMVYTCAMLLIFSALIVLLMFRSIRRSSSAIEMEALLDAMRFREELDLQQRQRRRLLKAKSKVAAWLTKKDDAWRSEQQLALPRKPTDSSNASDIPEIIVTDELALELARSRTPALSLLFDFESPSDTRSGQLLSPLLSLSMPRGSVCSSNGSRLSLVPECASPAPRNNSPGRKSLRRSCGSSDVSKSLDHDSAPPRLSICSQSMSLD